MSFFPVRAKFSIPDAETIRFVMNGDGCEIENSDLADVADLKETIMVLCGSDQHWIKVRYLHVTVISLR
jgi:hypothetical protein